MAKTMAERVDTNKLRRTADRRGYELVKSRQRDPLGLHYGKYGLRDVITGEWIFALGTATREQVIATLDRGR